MVLNTKNRVLRSASSTSAPAGRVKDSSTRKDYSRNSSTAVFGAAKRQTSVVLNRLQKVMNWSNTRKVPIINFMIIVIFMVVTLSTSLMLRTQMAELSFEQTATQSRISRLRQDVEAKQAKLDTLDAELPSKAQRMGMIPQQGSIAIDLSDYAAKRKHNHKNKKEVPKNNNSQDKAKNKPQDKPKNKPKNKTKEQQQKQQSQQTKQEKH
ncbi:hypothetical protein [Gardnerella leopoldii]|uniref:hypothetical protein n=1 Tax=Gardnerella leopoldii TaxID=2792978 RepID=UPI000E345A14|nr:hypothetical protein [Gardnerella vaginalis]NSX44231.1 hypothetical protein [Gardnerella vaginalis]RFT30188.1 hypothetical protein CG404_02905 [Bifidobacteriaceae bacterium VN003]